MMSQSETWPPMGDRVVRALREACEGRYGKNDGWLNALQIRNVILNTDLPDGTPPPIELLTSVWPVRRALRILPRELVEMRVVRRLTQYRLREVGDA